MNMTLDIVPTRGGNAAIVLRHPMLGPGDEPILVDGDPLQVISVREKIRELLSSIENPQRKARKKPKAQKMKAVVTIKEEAEAEVEAPPKRKRIPNLTAEQKRQIMEMSAAPAESGADPLTFLHKIAEKIGVEKDQVVRYWYTAQPALV